MLSKGQGLRGGVRRLLPWLAVAAALLLSVGSLALYGAHNLDADMSSGLVLADLLNEEGRLLTDGWYYGDDLNITGMTQALQLGLRIFPQDWHAAHVLGVLSMQLVFAASFLFMARGFGMREGGVWAAAAVLAPFGALYLNLNVWNGNGAAASAAGFLIAGLLARLGKKHALWLPLGALSVLAGLQGVRMLTMLGVPLLLVCLAEAFGALRRSETLREAARSEQARYFAGACVVLAGMCVGYLINSRVLLRICSCSGDVQTVIGLFELQRFLYQMEYLLSFFGFEQGAPYLSAEGMFSLLGLGLALALIVFAVLFAVRRKSLAPVERVFAGVPLACVALGVVLNAISAGAGNTKYAPGYYLLGVQCMIACAFFLLERMPCRMRGVRTLAMAALCGVFLLEGAASVRRLHASPVDYERAAEYLTQNGYAQGYAPFGVGNVLTQASDGALEVWTFDSYRDGKLGEWLQKKEHLEREPQGRVFAVVRPADERPETFEACLLEDFYGMRVYGFESAQAFWDALHEAIERDAFIKPNPNGL